MIGQRTGIVNKKKWIRCTFNFLNIQNVSISTINSLINESNSTPLKNYLLLLLNIDLVNIFSIIQRFLKGLYNFTNKEKFSFITSTHLTLYYLPVSNSNY